MRVLVVYESMFGNTQKIAGAVAEGLAGRARVDLVEVGEAATEPDGEFDLVVVGGPTHALGMSRPNSREQATKQAADGVVSRGIGMREWLAVAKIGDGMPVAVFDTRINKPRWLAGSAARGAAKLLRRSGGTLVAAPESFLVSDSTGPLVEGELERARRWGESLGAADASAASGRAS